MKDSKRIDNKLTAKKITAKKMAAYTLAACMTVTVAPLGATTPITVEAAIAQIGIKGDLNVEVKNEITVGMKFEDAKDKIVISDLAKTDSFGSISSADIKIKLTDGTVIYDSTEASHPNKANKFEPNRTYVIEAVFAPTTHTIGAINSVTVKDNVAAVNKTNLETTGYKVTLADQKISSRLDDYSYKSITDGHGCSVDVFYNRDAKGNVIKKETVAKNKDGWFYVNEDGEYHDGCSSYPRVADNHIGKWAVESANGQVDFKFDGLAEDEDGNIWYFEDSKACTNKTGIVNIANIRVTTGLTPGKYYIENGKVVDKPTVVHDKVTGNWISVGTNGKLGGITNALIQNQYGIWYVNGAGIVTFDYEGIKTDFAKHVTSRAMTYYVKDSKVDTNKTGIVFDKTLGYVSVKNGVVDESATTVGSDTVVRDTSSGDWYAVDKYGAINVGANFAKNAMGTWFINGGKVDFTCTDFVRDVNGEISSDKKAEYRVENGQVRFDKSGIVDGAYLEKGKKVGRKVDNSVVYDKNSRAWLFVDSNGDVDYAYGTDGLGSASTKLAGNSNGVWAIEFGKVNFDAEGFFTYGAGDDTTTEYYVKDGKVQTGKTGWATVNGTTKYVKNGKVTNPDETTVLRADNGKWLMADKAAATNDGVVTVYTGFVVNKYGTWFIDASNEVTFGVTGLKQDAHQVIAKDTTKYYYVENSKLDLTKTGVVHKGAANDHTTALYFENGAQKGRPANDSVVYDATSRAWYNFDEDGKVDVSAKIAVNKYGIWMTNTNGVVDFQGTANFHLITATEAKLTGIPQGTYIYMNESQFQSKATGLVADAGGNIKYVKNGIVTTSSDATDIIKFADGNWYFVQNGVVDTSYTGLATNKNGTWYVKNGIVDFNKTAIVESRTDSGEYYYVENGQLLTGSNAKNGIITVGSTKYNVKDNKLVGKSLGEAIVEGPDKKLYLVGTDGAVDTSAAETYAGNADGVYIVKNGVVDTNFTGVKTVNVTVPANGTRAAVTNSTTAYFKDGKLDTTATGVVIDSNNYYNVNKGILTGLADSNNNVVKGVDGEYYAVKDASTDGNLTLLIGEGVATFTKADATTELWYVNGGKADKTKTGIVADTLGSTKTYYVKEGVVSKSTTAVVYYANEYWNIKAGELELGVAYTDDTTAAVIKSDANGVKYVIGANGKLDTSVTGVVKNGTTAVYYYANAGIIDNKKTGQVAGGESRTYTFENGIGTLNP